MLYLVLRPVESGCSIWMKIEVEVKVGMLGLVCEGVYLAC